MFDRFESVRIDLPGRQQTQRTGLFVRQSVGRHTLHRRSGESVQRILYQWTVSSKSIVLINIQRKIPNRFFFAEYRRQLAATDELGRRPSGTCATSAAATTVRASEWPPSLSHHRPARPEFSRNPSVINDPIAV